MKIFLKCIECYVLKALWEKNKAGEVGIGFTVGKYSTSK